MKTFFQLREQKEQVTVGDYTTKHFDMCPSATALYSNIKDKTQMIHLVVENMMLQDLFFGLEKRGEAQGAIDADDLEKADHYAEMIMDNAEQMGLEEEHSYIEDVHMPRFEELAGLSDDEEEDDSEEEDMNEKTLTPAELKKREEIAKAIKRENPNMPMAKKMAIATATAKKVAEGVDDISSFGNRRLAMIASSVNHPDKAAAKNELARRRMQKEQVIEDAAAYLLDENIDVDDLSEQQINELLGSIVRGAAKLAYKGAKKAIVNNKGNFRFSTAGKADAADAQAKKLEKQNKDRERLKKAQERIRKARERAMRESFEQIDELSKKTLGSYVKGASASAAGIASGVGRDIGAGKKAHPDDTRQLRNRLKGVQRATDKLTKEETELDEAGAFSYGAKKPRKGSLRDIIAKKAREYEKSQPVIEPKNQMVGNAKVTKESVELDEAEVNYVIKHKKTKQVLNTHPNLATAKDEHEGLGADKHQYGVYKQTKKDAALRNRNTYREQVELEESEKPTYHYYVTHNKGDKNSDWTVTHSKKKPFATARDAADHIMKSGDRRGGTIHAVNAKTGNIVQARSYDRGQAGYARDPGIGDPRHIRDLKEEVELEESITNLSHARLKFHATKGVPHGSYSNKEIKAEHDRRMRTEPYYVKAKASMNEENLDEISAVKLGQYSVKAAGQGNKRLAGQKMADEKIRKKYGYSSDAKVAAGSLPKNESADMTTYEKARAIINKRGKGRG